MGMFTGGSAAVALPDLAVEHPLAMESQVIKMMSHCLVYGRSNLSSLFIAVSSLAPAYRNSRVEHLDMDEQHQWVVRLPNSGAAWIAIEGPTGPRYLRPFLPHNRWLSR